MSYVIDPIAPFPKRWRDKDGEPIRVMCEPTHYALPEPPARDATNSK